MPHKAFYGNPPSSGFWYRAGLNGIDTTGRRYLFSETYVSLEDEISEFDTATALRTFTFDLAHPFGTYPGLFYGGLAQFVQRLWPRPKLLVPTVGVASPAFPQLNPAAPEACVRLQRVGASGGLGRIALPILNDSIFTDVPHRRHVDAVALQTALNSNLNLRSFHPTFSGRHYFNAILHRHVGTWEPVYTYRAMPSTLRIWQRWRIYGSVVTHPSDFTFFPPEATY